MKTLFGYILIILFNFLGPQFGNAAAGDSVNIKVFDKFHLSRYGAFDQKVKFPNEKTPYRNIKMKFTLGCLSNGQCEWDYTLKLYVRERTGKLDSTLKQAPSFRVNGQIKDSINYSSQPTYINTFNTVTKKTDSAVSTIVNIVRYNNPAKPLTITDTLKVWPVQFYRYWYDSIGKKADSAWVQVEQTVKVSYTPYYEVFEIINNYELGRFISPYAVNFPKNFQYNYEYDVTDFSSLLQDSAEIRIEYQGYSYGFTATMNFTFVEGTPARQAYKVQNVYNGGFDYGNPNNSIENKLSPQSVAVDAEAKSVKLRILITGHGGEQNENCAEFCAKKYYLKLNGQQFAEQLIWKDDCGTNALYPQPGTWVYNRANWCPGELIRPFDYEMKTMTASNNYTIDMDMEPFVSNGNASYNIAAQLFYYKDYAFQNDAALNEILSPTKEFWHNRNNPICDNAEVSIKNYGKQNLTSAIIKVQIGNEEPQHFNWSGNLAFDKIATVKLPWIKWPETISNKTFTASIELPNGKTDENTWNDNSTRVFDIPPTLPLKFVVETRTNAVPSQNSYTIKNSQGNVFTQRDFLQANTLHRDTIELGYGCYTFTFKDEQGNGMGWWATPSDGNGSLRIVEIPIKLIKAFSTDFGTSHVFHFRAGSTVGLLENRLNPLAIKVFPQPATNAIFIESPYAFENAQIIAIDGKRVHSFSALELSQNRLTVSGINKGMYLLQMTTKLGEFTVKKIVIE